MSYFLLVTLSSLSSFTVFPIQQHTNTHFTKNLEAIPNATVAGLNEGMLKPQREKVGKLRQTCAVHATLGATQEAKRYTQMTNKDTIHLYLSYMYCNTHCSSE